jgi:hypothetical protein
MIPSLGEILAALYGSYRLLRGDAGGLKYFVTSREGTIRSFFAAVLVFPIFSLMIYGSIMKGQLSAPVGTIVAVHVLVYLISWAVYPLVVYEILGLMKRQDRFLTYLCAFNWCHVLQALAFLPVVMYALAIPDGNAVLSFLRAAVFVAVMVYQWFVNRSALGVGSMAAIGFLMLEQVLDMALEIAMYASLQ